MNNIPEVKVGIVAVSRDCFPESLSVGRREALVKAYADKYNKDDIYECPVCIVESEIHMPCPFRIAAGRHFPALRSVYDERHLSILPLCPVLSEVIP